MVEFLEELFVIFLNCVRICYQIFGNFFDFGVIFISGYGCLFYDWNEDMFQFLMFLFDFYFIVCFDHCDVGFLIEFFVLVFYIFFDMVGDIEGLICYLNVGFMYVVGGSFGGFMVWIVVVRSLELICIFILVYISFGISFELLMVKLNQEVNLGIFFFVGGDQC